MAMDSSVSDIVSPSHQARDRPVRPSIRSTVIQTLPVPAAESQLLSLLTPEGDLTDLLCEFRNSYRHKTNSLARASR